MAITANINGDTYQGPTLAEIIDREYGNGAGAAQSRDPNDPYWGKVVRRAGYSSFEVLGTIRWVEGEEDRIDVGQALQDLRDTSHEIHDLDATRTRLEEQRNLLIRQVARAGLPIKDIMAATGLSRARIDTIRRATHE